MAEKHESKAPEREGIIPADLASFGFDPIRQAAEVEAELQRRRAAAGAQLPAVRLDEAGPGYHFVLPDGRTVDANGNPVKPEGPYLKGDAE